jgi:hypothetical protein
MTGKSTIKKSGFMKCPKQIEAEYLLKWLSAHVSAKIRMNKLIILTVLKDKRNGNKSKYHRFPATEAHWIK